MTVILKKNIMPAFSNDVKGGIEFMKRIQSDLGITPNKKYRDLVLNLGFEAIVRYGDMDNLSNLWENLKQAEGYPLSLHAPLNHPNPELVDINGKGFRILERLVEFSDKNKISLIITHPNALRRSDKFSDYSREKQRRDLRILAENIQKLNKHSSAVTVCVENKPNPATDEKNEGVLYSPLAALFSHLAYLKHYGVPITFDTAHYAITRSTVNSLLATAENKKINLSKRLSNIPGFFIDDFRYQPGIPEALDYLSDSVKEIHLNDAAPYKYTNKVLTFWESVIPGKGTLVGNESITGFLKKRKKDISVLFEVMEKDYKLSPNAYASINNFLKDLVQ